MLLQLEEFKSTHPDYKAPQRHNGEPMDLFSVDSSGPFMVARYFNIVPLEGPKFERYFVDIYYNGEGKETFRVLAKIVDTPPPPPTFRQRLSSALRTLFPD
jgi:hypothetical protein